MTKATQFFDRCRNIGASTRCEPGESTGAAKIQFLLVKRLRELLRNNEIRSMSDWGSPGAAFSLAREARWHVEVVEGRLVQPPATDGAIVDAARRLLLNRGWDVVDVIMSFDKPIRLAKAGLLWGSLAPPWVCKGIVAQAYSMHTLLA